MTQSMSVLGFRVSRTDANGAPDFGNPVGSMYVCSGVRTFQMTDNVEAGDDIAEKDGANRLCVTRKYDDSLKRVDFNIEMCDDSRKLKEILGIGTAVTVNGDPYGGLITQARTGCSNPTPRKPVILEVYVENWECSGPSSPYPYKVIVYPRVFLSTGDRTFQSGLVPLTLTGFAETTAAFSDGPFGDYDEVNVAPYNTVGFLRYEKDIAALPSSVDCLQLAALPGSAS
jgi:hypothetical protein